MTSYKTNKKLSVTQSFSFFKTNRSRWMMQKQQEENGDLENRSVKKFNLKNMN